MWRTGFSWLRMESNGKLCEHGNEPSGCTKKAGYCLTSSVASFQRISCTMELVNMEHGRRIGLPYKTIPALMRHVCLSV
jgi:hypothetical protein